MPPSKPIPDASLRPRRRMWKFWLLGIAVVLSAWYLNQTYSRIARAERAFARGDLETAMLLASEELEARPESDRGHLIVGLVYVAIRDYSAAQPELERVSSKDPTLYSVSQRELGRIAFEFGQASAAEKYLRQAIDQNPNDPDAIDQLILLLSLEGRSSEVSHWAENRVQAGLATPNYLMILGAPQAGLEATTLFAQRCLAANHQDTIPRLGLAYQAWRDDKFEEVRTQLQPVLEQHPELIAAQSLWCRLLVELNDDEGFAAAQRSLPKSADSDAEIWLARGLWAERQKQLPAAVRCFGESIRLDPDSRTALYRISQVLTAIGEPQLAAKFAARSQQLTQLSLLLNRFRQKGSSDDYRALVESLEQLGREWEAVAWCRRLQSETGSMPDWAQATADRLSPRLKQGSPLVTNEANLSRLLRLSDYPLPDWTQRSNSPSTGRSPIVEHRIHFDEEAAQSGIQFTYVNGELPGDAESMRQMNGGGIAVLDYDCDSLPDLYFTQGGELPPAPISSLHRDQLFRNRGADAKFANVTSHLGLLDSDYGQGVTAGDFDNDGFPDLYVGNIGTNRLCQNNGDGTFSEIEMESASPATIWTSSCVLADLNGDANPDLYVVTYLGGEALTKICSKRSNPRCNPLEFPAEPDRVYLNAGDGSFRDVTGQFGLSSPDGRGLGIVAADFDGSHRLSLFVANDMSANFYFRNESKSPDAPIFQEQAIVSGLAYDQDGRAKACMGIAAGDSNRDGLLDLYVTNFYRQSNDLFLQQADGSFRDQSREAGLSHASFDQLGWGTQFLDADLDGEMDLMVTNGHVYDPMDSRIRFAMPPQLFRNHGQGQYSEVPAATLGPYFEQAWHGRALARLNWNRDGREDVCISPNNQPAALLTNHTQTDGHWISFRLIAINSARDAIGSTIHLKSGDQNWTAQLTAGDGFQASNERRIHCGLGACQMIDSLEVVWPSGTRQEFRGIETDRDWLLVEGREPLTGR